MPSGNGAAPSPKAPPELAPDLRRFVALIRPALEHRTVARGAEPGRTAAALDLLIRFGLLVHEQSESQALVAKGDRSRLFTRHLLDSLAPLNLFQEAPGNAMDIGSGGGFPGMPLAIVWPETRFTLLESRDRKAGFLERAVRDLGLRNVKVVCERVEGAARGWSVEPVDAIFIRAVGGLDDLLRHGARIAAPGCRWVYFLGAERNATSLRDPLDARGLDSDVVEGLFGSRLLTGIIRGGE